MVYEWTIATNPNNNPASASSWKYFNSPEDGARATKGWFKVIAPDSDNDNTFKDYDENYGSFAAGDAEDENERWYYANGDGELEVGKIKKIKGKYYGFRPEGSKGAATLSDLVFMQTDGKGNITNVWDDSVDSDELDDIIAENVYDDNWPNDLYTDSFTRLYYFGSDADTDGAIKTGSVTVSLDGDSYNFMFNKSGGAEAKGKGVTGIDDEKYIYKYGLKIKAGTDDKYRVVEVKGALLVDDNNNPILDDKGNQKVGGKDTSSKNVSVTKITSAEIRDMTNEIETNKDGDDWYFYVNSNKEIVMYLNNKTIKGDTKEGYIMPDLSKWDNWK